MSRDDRQIGVRYWCMSEFGATQTMSVPQRALRFLEEALELYQACGGDREQAHKLLDFVFSRPVGVPFQELGGVGTTTLALANALNISADQAEYTEYKRCLEKNPGSFTKRNDDKNAAGFIA